MKVGAHLMRVQRETVETQPSGLCRSGLRMGVTIRIQKLLGTESNAGIAVTSIVSVLGGNRSEVLGSHGMRRVPRREHGHSLLTGRHPRSHGRCRGRTESARRVRSIALAHAAELHMALISSSFADRTQPIRRTVGTAQATPRSLQSGMRERGGIHGRHPDSSLVDLEEIRHQTVEVDV